MTNKINIEGIAIVEGVSRNKIMYKADVLHKFANTLTGRPILKDHSNLTDQAIGKVTLGESIDGGKKVRYSGWIKEDGTGIIDKIKDGRISEVSIGAVAGKVVKESRDSDIMIAKDLVALELSTTPCPGVIGTSLMPAIESYREEDIKKMIEDYNKELKLEEEKNSYSRSQEHDIINNERRIKMESTENKEIKTETVIKVDESIELKAKLAEAEKQIANMKEVQRQDMISAYKAKCTEKGIIAKDVSAMQIETISAMKETIDSFVLPVKVEEKKEIAMPKTADVVVEKKEVSYAFDNYVLETSSLGGWSFYRN